MTEPRAPLASAARTSALAALRELAADLGLDADRLALTAIVNAGGFVNASFRVSDGTRRVHLKVALEPETIARLRRWHDLRDRLEREYRAPAMLAWIDLADAGAAGAVFEHVEGASPDTATPEIVAELTPVLERLHADAGLAARLGAPTGETCRHRWDAWFLDRFTEDLAFVAPRRPAGVDASTVAWIEEEIDRLRTAVHASDAFDEPVTSAVHGDLWLENVLVARDGRIVVLDWDEIHVGDPAMEWATLLGPSRARVKEGSESDLPSSVRRDAAAVERFRLHARSTLLDWVLDPLADHVAADALPEHADAVRAEKLDVHRRALDAYRGRYG